NLKNGFRVSGFDVYRAESDWESSAGITGELLVNGQDRDEQHFQMSSCYITQEDLLQPLLTVREAMDVAASLKLPRGSEAPSEEILQELGLLEHQNTRTDQLSGGQKKRLSIALEMVNNPPVFFLDEPTSGLDTVSTTQCIKLLKQLARQGRTVVYVMADGQCIYQGDTGAIVPHLQNVGLSCPKHHNPADFIIEISEDTDIVEKLSNEILNGKLYKTTKLDEAPSKPTPTNNMPLKVSYQPDENDTETEIMLTNEKCSYKVPRCKENSESHSSLSSQSSQVNTSGAWMKVQINSTNSFGYSTTFCEQFSILLCRMIKQISRNRQGLWIQLIHHVMCGFLIGWCFWRMADDGSQMFNHLKLCVALVIFFAYTQIMVPVLVFPQEVKLVKKEHFNCWYGLSAYYAALTVSKLPLQVALNVVFSTIVYFMAGIPFEVERFTVFCLIGNIVSLVAEGMGLAIGSVFSVRNGCAIGPAAIAPFLGLGIYGFDFAHQIPLLMNLLMKTSFIRCGIVAMILTIFGFNRKPLECNEIYCHFAKPKVLIRYLDIESTSVWYEILIMIGIMLLFRTAGFLGLRYRFAT
ncbi:ATP-binding cassette sub-family G member 1, partial [Operophtera brumata]